MQVGNGDVGKGRMIGLPFVQLRFRRPRPADFTFPAMKSPQFDQPSNRGIEMTVAGKMQCLRARHELCESWRNRRRLTECNRLIQANQLAIILPGIPLATEILYLAFYGRYRLANSLFI